MSKIVAIATEVPAFRHYQNDILAFADSIYSKDETDARKLKYLYRHSGIKTRYSVMPDYSVSPADRKFYATSSDLEPFPGIEKRMQWYDANATSISVKAIRQCIAGKIIEKEITHLITVSCTGMSAPGLDLEIMETMELPGHIFRTSVNFMGCYAAIHALKLADAICAASVNANVVIVCTEFCTLHFQKESTIDNITSTLLFGDGCAAILVQQNETPLRGIRVQHFFSDVLFKGKNDMAWKISSSGFLMMLSGYVPDLVKEDFDGLVNRSLEKAAISKKEITHWCIHPGGKKILEAIEKSISLPAESLRHSYQVLSEYGNMSSPTILFVLQKIYNELLELQPGKAIIFGAAFGPGLTMETFIASYD